MLKIFLAQIQNHLSLLKLKINLWLCRCTVRVFRLTANKPIYLVLANDLSKKNFFLYYVTIAACLKSLSFQQIFSTKDKKAFYCFIYLYFFI